MAPTRLRCLNASRHISKTGSSLKAAFSTTRIACTNDSPSRSSATADLLASLGESPPKPQSSPNLYTNPIRAPPRQSSIFSSKPPSPSPGNSTANTRLMNLMRQQAAKRERAEATSQPGTRTNTLEELQKHKMAADLSKQITRRWKAGDVYAPHDLSAAEMGKWKNRSRPLYDVFDVLDFNPLDHYRNFSVMSEYMTPMGRIKHSKETGLRPVNQRRIARAIRRTIGMGMMPSVHRHPEILQKQAMRAEMNSPWRVKPL